MFGEFFERQVEPSALGVFAEVAKDVGQLEREAAFAGRFVSRFRLVEPDVQATDADGRSHLFAVIGQFDAGRERLGTQVASDAGDQCVQVPWRDAPAANRVHDRGQERITVVAGQSGVPRIAPPIQRRRVR